MYIIKKIYIRIFFCNHVRLNNHLLKLMCIQILNFVINIYLIILIKKSTKIISFINIRLITINKDFCIIFINKVLKYNSIFYNLYLLLSKIGVYFLILL